MLIKQTRPDDRSNLSFLCKKIDIIIIMRYDLLIIICMSYEILPLIEISQQSKNTDFLVVRSDTEIRSVVRKSLISNKQEELPISITITNKKEVKDFLISKGGYKPFTYLDGDYTCRECTFTSLGQSQYQLDATFQAFY